MVGKLEERVSLKKLPPIDENIFYKINLYGTRKESEGSYILYNGNTLWLMNK